MSNPDSQQEMIRAASELAEEFRLIREDLATRLETAEQEESRSRHLIHRLTGTVAVLAFLLAVATAGFAAWNHYQDDVRAAAHQAGLERDARQERQIAALEQQLARGQQENTQFRLGACVEAEDWKIYLDANPGSTPASRAAAHRIAAMAARLCKP